MKDESPVLLDDTRRVEKLVFEFSNPGEVHIEAPVVVCKNTKLKFIHPDDIDSVLDELDSEYERVHKKLNKRT